MKIGHKNCFRLIIIGNHSLHQETNYNRFRLIDLGTGKI